MVTTFATPTGCTGELTLGWGIVVVKWVYQGTFTLRWWRLERLLLTGAGTAWPADLLRVRPASAREMLIWQLLPDVQRESEGGGDHFFFSS